MIKFSSILLTLADEVDTVAEVVIEEAEVDTGAEGVETVDAIVTVEVIKAASKLTSR